MATTKTYRYSDINLFAGQTPTDIVTDEASVNQNILLILMTPIRSAWFDPTIGSNIPQYLFEPLDELTARKIQNEATRLLVRNGETRVQFTNVQVLVNYDTQDFYVKIEYIAPDLDSRKIVFDFNISK